MSTLKRLTKAFALSSLILLASLAVGCEPGDLCPTDTIPVTDPDGTLTCQPVDNEARVTTF
ncbi:MAG TPA: hypothetical protein VGV59_11840 [Pyrinomonadaceae bacterium]|nr:hypothetical protein [Pyrinomonadaceae bacterium]